MHVVEPDGQVLPNPHRGRNGKTGSSTGDCLCVRTRQGSKEDGSALQCPSESNQLAHGEDEHEHDFAHVYGMGTVSCSTPGGRYTPIPRVLYQRFACVDDRGIANVCHRSNAHFYLIRRAGSGLCTVRAAFHPLAGRIEILGTAKSNGCAGGYWVTTCSDIRMWWKDEDMRASANPLYLSRR